MNLQFFTNTPKSRAGRQFVFQPTPDLTRVRILTETDKQEVLSVVKIHPV